MALRYRMGPVEMSEPLYICVHVPEFPAQALLRLRPELARTPVVVLAGEPPLQLVCSLNMQATRLGVMQGMTRAELDGFDGLSILRRSDAEERIAQAALVEAAGTFTPRVEVQPSVDSAFVMVLDMTGTTRIFGPGNKAVSSIQRTLQTLHVHAQLAASANLPTAVCVAATARAAAAIIPPGQERARLSSLPLAALNLTPQQHQTLDLWGLHTLGELGAIAEEELVVRLGQQGRRLRLLARGEHDHLMVPAEPVFALEELVAFDEPIEILDSLLFILGPMLDQLLTRAQNHSLALASVTVRLALDGGGQHERTVKPALPVLEREVLLKLLHLDLQAHPPPAGVMSVFVHAEPGDRSKVQLGLFAAQLPDPLRLDVTIARIAALVGEDRVGRARLLDTHRAEGFVMERFIVPTTLPKAGTKPSAKAALRRCRPPVPVSVRHQGQRLAAFTFHGKRYVVQEAYGPWRKSGEWWMADVWSREEWDVSACVNADDVLLCVLTRDLLRQQWHMEAMYD